MTTRRSLLKQSTALGIVGMLPQPVEGATASLSQPATPSAATGRTTTYIMRGMLVINEGMPSSSMHYRELRFTVNHHEDFRDNTVDVVVEHPLRPQDAFDFQALPRQKLSGVLCEIHDYVSEQERRARADGSTNASALRSRA